MKQKPVVGAQLYTLREHTKTPDAIAKTFEKVAAIGYTSVQLSGLGPVDPRELARMIKESGLKVAATHVGWDRFLKDLDALIEEHRMWGCTHPAIGGLPGEYRTEAGAGRFIKELIPIAERLAEAGMDFSYHNHHMELARFGGKTWLEMLYDGAEPRHLKAEIDVYWIQVGGGDPASWIRKCAGRQPLLHLKDLAVTTEGEVRTAEVGEGNLDWPGILKAAAKSGVEHLLVEQDNCYGRDPFESLAISYRNLKSWGYC